MLVRLNSPDGDLILSEGTAILGRGSDCGLRLNEPRLSRHHARLHLHGEVVEVEDLGSTNGVLLNGKRIAAITPVKAGDTIVCGPCVFTVAIDHTRATPRHGRSNVDADAGKLGSTDAMDPIEIAAQDAAPAAPARQLDPHIAAKVSPGTEGTGPILNPDEDSHPETSALDARRKSRLVAVQGAAPPAPPPPESARRHQTTGLIPDDDRPAKSTGRPDLGAVTDVRARTLPRRRLAAGVLDPLAVALVVVLTALPVTAGGYAWALARAGTVLEEGLPRLAPAAAQTPALTDLALSLFRAGGLERAGQLVLDLHRLADQGPFLIVFCTVTAVVLIAALAGLIGVVAATVLRGGPYWHHRLGLEIVEHRTGCFPTWTRALLRWSLLVPLAPLAFVTALTGRAGLHDRLAGCQVRQHRRL